MRTGHIYSAGRDGAECEGGTRRYVTRVTKFVEKTQRDGTTEVFLLRFHRRSRRVEIPSYALIISNVLAISVDKFYQSITTTGRILLSA